MIDDTPRCGNCKFYREFVGSNGVPFTACARHAPTFVAVLQPKQERWAVYSGFPPIDADKWCGEYERRVS